MIVVGWPTRKQNLHLYLVQMHKTQMHQKVMNEWLELNLERSSADLEPQLWVFSCGCLDISIVKRVEDFQHVYRTQDLCLPGDRSQWDQALNLGLEAVEIG